VNNDTSHPRMTVIPADGLLVSSYKSGRTMNRYDYVKQLNGDIFRVDDTYSDSTFTQSSNLPNAKWWTAAAETPVYNINYKDSAVYFDFLNRVATTGVAPTIFNADHNASEKIYTIDGRYVGTSTDSLPRGIYIRGGRKIIK